VTPAFTVNASRPYRRAVPVAVAVPSTPANAFTLPDTAIDSAFRRRLAVHVEFPFPDEDERLRLWNAHLPRALPTRGDLGLRELAETYELSGGYIRNAALRAAYLAAGRADAPAITADDLRRAIKLEKERVGKLGNGRIE
jgi:AAA+ superfamily predicted ATPase